METKSIFIASIAERDSNGDLYSCLLHGKTESELVEKVNNFFEEEKEEGHEVPDAVFSSVSEIDSMSLTDVYEDREYALSAQEIKL